MAEFAKIFKKLRLERELSQSRLADQLGISKSAVNMYQELRPRSPRLLRGASGGQPVHRLLQQHDHHGFPELPGLRPCGSVKIQPGQMP